MNIFDPVLRIALRTLKLTGMLDTLDARLAQTRDGTLGHLDFLQVLCEDEIARHGSAAVTRRIRRALFREQLSQYCPQREAEGFVVVGVGPLSADLASRASRC